MTTPTTATITPAEDFFGMPCGGAEWRTALLVVRPCACSTSGIAEIGPDTSGGGGSCGPVRGPESGATTVAFTMGGGAEAP